jgi:hypothetical protein
MSASSDRINFLASINEAKSYLEIGVSNGFTFNNVKIDKKDAVDVRFGFDVSSFENEFVRFFEEPSDTFFSSDKPMNYDIIFIDGLHTFEQTLRDFIASFRHSNRNTIWIIDDTIPSDVFSCLRDPSDSRGFRGRHGLTGADWHGDVYKVVAFIHDFFPTVEYRTVWKGGNPQTIAMWGNRKVNPIYNSAERISRLNYFELDEFDRTDGFQKANFDDIAEWIKQNVQRNS